MKARHREPPLSPDPPRKRLCLRCRKAFRSDGLRMCPACSYIIVQMGDPVVAQSGGRVLRKKAAD